LTILPALLFSGAIILFYPYYLKPNCTQQIMIEAQLDSEKIANYFINYHGTEIADYHLNDTDKLEASIEKNIKIFQLWKVRLFNSDGVIVYSSKKKELGNVNHKPYFRDIVSKGKNYSKIVEKKDFTASGSIAPYSVVETYVPIMENGKFQGAYEIYLNVTLATKNPIQK